MPGVGIARTTGHRWRAEVGGVVPLRLAEAVRSDRYLSLLERQRIAALHGQGVSVREIARRLDRNPSTVSRELRRNSAAHERGKYDAPLAYSRARAGGARPGRSRLAADLDLRAEVQAKLEIEWSPEQIAAHRRLVFPDRPGWHLCHETIYQALYRGALGGLNRQLTKLSGCARSPGSPWVRGTNENTGLLRQYLRKGTDLRVHNGFDLAVIEAKLNARPRKILGWKHPPRSSR